MPQTSGSLKGRGYRLVHQTFSKSLRTANVARNANVSSEQTEKQETSSLLTDSRQNHRSISPYIINFVRTVPESGFENISSCPLVLEGIVLLVLIVQTEHR